jgi:diguanylate cyclase (GGDEF)-like protein/PAS domain S-box-containing protein
MPQILILDDRITNQRILSRLAASVEPGITVQAFGDPLEALAWLAVHDADLIITDFKMPNLDGAEVTRRLRADPRTADVPIVVVTVYDDRQLRMLALDAGATDFLLAPVDHVEFRTRVRNLLALRRHQIDARRQAERLRHDLAASERLRTDLMRASRESLAQLIDTVPAMVSAADRDGRLVFVNAAQADAVGKRPADLVGQEMAALFGPERAAFSREMDAEVFARDEALPGFEESATQPDGTRTDLLTTKAPLRDAAGRIVAVLSTSIDITDRKRAEERLLHLAQHDPLTALPNRAYLGERLREYCGHGRRADDGFALHVLDLDRFKAVNDALGHQAGDRLLVQVARRLRAALRETDVVARLGGDEFAILQQDIGGAADAGHLATRMLDAFQKPFRIAGRSITMTAGIGITLYPKDATSADELLRNADLAMYRAKESGRSGFGFFDPEMDAAAQKTMRLETELRRALSRREFELVWQPQVSLRTGRISGAEALLRWRHAERGLIPPADFLSLAEETGLIAPITEWALGAACAQGVLWAKRRAGGLRISANLSPSLFVSRDVRDMVVDAISGSGLDPALLDLEITERVLVDNVDEVAATLHALREIGVSFSIDDFGTGYSSLAYAKSFPVQRLKIDQSFIAHLDTDRADAAIVGAIVSLAHGLGMEVVAEGVETAEQVAALRRLGCDEVQGYFVREPITADELTAMLDADIVHLAAG